MYVVMNIIKLMRYTQGMEREDITYERHEVYILRLIKEQMGIMWVGYLVRYLVRYSEIESNCL